jgi:hypothetical protein
MALKRKITKAEHAALNPLLQAEYKAEGEDFILDASGYEDPGELKRALDREKQAKKDAEAEALRLKTELATITNTDARRAGDIATLEKSWQGKLDAEKADAAMKLAQKDKFINETLVDSVALAVSTELAAENAIVLLPHVKQRLAAELTGEKPLTRVLDKDGKPSALSVDDLKKEFAGDKRFASVVIASRASGGGAAGGNGSSNNGGAGSGGKKFKELNDQERTDYYKRDPKGFEQAAAADRRVF